MAIKTDKDTGSTDSPFGVKLPETVEFGYTFKVYGTMADVPEDKMLDEKAQLAVINSREKNNERTKAQNKKLDEIVKRFQAEGKSDDEICKLGYVKAELKDSIVQQVQQFMKVWLAKGKDRPTAIALSEAALELEPGAYAAAGGK